MEEQREHLPEIRLSLFSNAQGGSSPLSSMHSCRSMRALQCPSIRQEELTDAASIACLSYRHSSG